MAEDILEILDKIAPLIYIVVPAVAAIWWNLKSKLKEKEKEVKKTNQAKAKELYDTWEHEESKSVITKIKNFCNLYKDKGNVDLVQYLQLENGTMATSKIQNMFITCLAEDDRFGKIPKLISKMQRTPYSECSSWLTTLQNSITDGNKAYTTPDLQTQEYNKNILEGFENKIGSVIITPVLDPNEILLGVCVFYYHEKNYNNGDPKTEEAQILRFREAVENVLFVYYQNRKNKKQQLGLEDV